MTEYWPYLTKQDRKKLMKLYPGKVFRTDKYLCICIACGGYFTTNRRDKKVCDATCRSLLRRQRAKLPQLRRFDDLPWKAPF